MDFCLYADVYGFSAMVRSDIEETSRKLKKLTSASVKLVDRFKQSTDAELNIKFFSDNLIMVYQPSARGSKNISEELEQFTKLCASLYDASIENAMPFRGSISAGHIDMTEDGQFLGIPIIEAVEFEKGIRLPMIFLPIHIIDRLAKTGAREIQRVFEKMVIDVPFGDGVIAAAPLIIDHDDRLSLIAQQNYLALRANIKTVKAAKDWRDVLALLRKFRNED